MVDGRLVAAAQEERFSRIKHDASFPSHAVAFCLQQAGITIDDVDQVGFYERPMVKFDRLLETHLAVAPAHASSFRTVMREWLGWKVRVTPRVRRELGLPRRCPLRFCDHHRSHARTAYDVSPFANAAVVTIDAVGEWATTVIASGDDGHLTPRRQLHFPHSLGLLYSAFTAFAGFKVNDGEYKLMGLAPLGTPRYVDTILEHVVTLHDDGSFRLNLDLFDFTGSDSMLTDRFGKLFDSPPRDPSSPIREIDRDLAASIQSVTETIVLRIARHARELTGHENLCMAGGVAMNCSANGRLLREHVFERVWVQPASGDAGGAVGVALELDREIDHEHHARSAESQPRPPFDNRLGPGFDDESIGRTLRDAGLRFETLDDPTLCDRAAALIAAGNVVGWFQGRMEFGPRALGGRSIVADPRDPDMQRTLNLKTKFRESFRPFAPVVLQDQAETWFQMDGHTEQPYMTSVFPVRPDRRDRLPAVAHVDGTARVQSVPRSEASRWSGLLEAFERQTGTPVLINTSFNVAAEPIVCTPLDALRCFFATRLDALVIGNRLLIKSDQPATVADNLTVRPERENGTNDGATTGDPAPPRRGVWRRFADATEPLRARIESGLINAFYYAVITPFGWTLRMFGFDPLRRKPSSEPTAWIVPPTVNLADQRSASSPASRYGLLGEFLQFLREEKKWWLAPLLLMIAFLSLLVAVSASPVAPFIYTLF